MNLPEKITSHKERIEKVITYAATEIEKEFANGVTTDKQDASAKETIQQLDTFLKEYNAERMAITKRFDEIKKDLMIPEKEIKVLTDQLASYRDTFANERRLEVAKANYKEQFFVMLNAALKNKALDSAANNSPVKSIDLSTLLPKPAESHLIQSHIDLCMEWQPKATQVYLKYYNDAPKGAEEVEAEKELTETIAAIAIEEKVAELVDYKPKGSREVVKVNLTHPDALKRVLGLYFAEKRGSVLNDPKLAFVAKYAESLSKEALAKLAETEGFSYTTTLKTSKR